MDIRKLQRAIVDGLEDVKAQDILVLNTEHLSALFERVIIASGTSNRQTKALASSVREAVKAAGMPVLATEGGENGEWIIVDCGAAVAHIMQPAIRDYYRLEEIWGGKPVRMKSSATGSRGLVKASEPDEDDEPPALPIAKADGKRRGATMAAVPPRKAAAAPHASTVKPSAKAAPAKKAAAKKAAAKAVAAKWAPAKKAPATKVAAKKAMANTAMARKAATRALAGNPPPKKAPVGRYAAPAAAARTVVVKPADRRTAAGKTAAALARRPVAAKKTVAARPAARKTRGPRG